MSSVCCAPGGVVACDVADGYPCVVENARDACREALSELYAEHPLSRPDYWVGRLGFLMEYLLAATEPPGD